MSSNNLKARKVIPAMGRQRSLGLTGHGVFKTAQVTGTCYLRQVTRVQSPEPTIEGELTPDCCVLTCTHVTQHEGILPFPPLTHTHTYTYILNKYPHIHIHIYQQSILKLTPCLHPQRRQVSLRQTILHFGILCKITIWPGV